LRFFSHVGVGGRLYFGVDGPPTKRRSPGRTLPRASLLAEIYRVAVFTTDLVSASPDKPSRPPQPPKTPSASTLCFPASRRAARSSVRLGRPNRPVSGKGAAPKPRPHQLGSRGIPFHACDCYTSQLGNLRCLRMSPADADFRCAVGLAQKGPVSPARCKLDEYTGATLGQSA